MSWTLRACIAIAGLLGYLLHYAMHVRLTLEGLTHIDAQFFSNALSDPLRSWFAIPYLVLAFGMICRTTPALLTVLGAMIAVALFDVAGYAPTNQDRGWHVMLYPVYLFIPSVMALIFALWVNKATWSDPPEQPRKDDSSDEYWKIDA